MRPPPAERLAGTKHREQATQVLFAFDADGFLKEHSAPELVVIHALEGHIRVEAGGRTYDLAEDHELVLDRDVPHDAHAVARSAMLLTVHLKRTD